MNFKINKKIFSIIKKRKENQFNETPNSNYPDYRFTYNCINISRNIFIDLHGQTNKLDARSNIR